MYIPVFKQTNTTKLCFQLFKFSRRFHVDQELKSTTGSRGFDWRFFKLSIFIPVSCLFFVLYIFLELPLIFEVFYSVLLFPVLLFHNLPSLIVGILSLLKMSTENTESFQARWMHLISLMFCGSGLSISR